MFTGTLSQDLERYWAKFRGKEYLFKNEFIKFVNNFKFMEAEKHILTETQINFVKSLSERSISDNEIRNMKQLISLYFVAKADAKMNEIWKEKTFSEKKMLQILDAVL